MSFVFAFIAPQLPVACTGINTRRLFDFIHPPLSGPGCVAGCGAVIYGSVLEVYMRHPHTDPSARSLRGPLAQH